METERTDSRNGAETESLEGLTPVNGLYAIVHQLQRIADAVEDEQHQEARFDLQRLTSFIKAHQGCETEDILMGLSMSKQYALRLLEKATAVHTEGKGIKGDPHKYYVAAITTA